MTADNAERVAILGTWTSPLAQLLPELADARGATLIQAQDLPGDLARADRIIVLSQMDAVAHLPDLAASGKPCTVVLRRQSGRRELAEWQAGITLFRDCLDQTDWPDLDLAAMTQSAADNLADRMDRPIRVLGSLTAVTGQRPRVAVRRNEPDLVFTLDLPNGARETRRCGQRVLSWARLRRLGRPFPGDADDLDLADLCAFAQSAPGPDTPSRTTGYDGLCILSVVPNGVGLGHITRMMAIGNALKSKHGVRIVFWSYSRAAEILQAAGFEVILRQNAVHLNAHPPSWREWETLEFAETLRHLNVKVVTFDGGTIDPFGTEALLHPGCGGIGVIWVRRGMLRADADAQLLEAEQYCDLVLEPGDLAVEMDKGPTRMRRAERKGFSRTFVSTPITLKPFLPSYSRKLARKRLRLGRGRHCLVSLGGAFGDWTRVKALIEEKARLHRISLIWAQSPLAPPIKEADSNTKVRRFYPLSRYLDAFDGMITATGYNSFHELMMGYDGPVLLAPTNFERMDDQVARATHAQTMGWAQVLRSDELDSQAEIIGSFMQQVRRGERNARRPLSSDPPSDVIAPILEVCDRYI